MTDIQFKRKVYERLNKKYTIPVVNEIIKTTFECLKDEMKKNISVQITRFGTFTTRFFNARKGYDMYHKKAVDFDGRYVPVFKPSILLRNFLKNS